MANHATLSYSGRKTLETNSDGTLPQTEVDTLHTLLDDAISAYEGNTLIVRSAVVHFERGDGGTDMPRAHIELEASGRFSGLGTVEDNLAQTVVNIGFEPDTTTAKDQIQVE